MPPEAKRLARTATLALLGIETLAAYSLLRRTSLPAVIFGRYSPEYFVVLVAFAGMWLVTLYLALRPSARLAARVAAVARWLHQRWWLSVLLLYGALEGWYSQVGQNKPLIVFMPVVARRSFMTALLLFLIWVALVLLFAGQSKAERKKTAANLRFALIGVGLCFWLLSLVDTRVLSREEYRRYHDFWAPLHRYDYELGYRGRPNVRYDNIYCAPEVGDVTIFTDDLGYRNLPGASDAPVVVVGDSNVYDACKNYEDMWSTQLGEALGVDTANYSTAGTSLYHYNKLTDLLVRRGDHQVLIYGISTNDLIDDSSLDVSLHDRLALSGILYYMSPITFTGERYLTESPGSQIVRAIRNTGVERSPPRRIVTLDNGVQLDETGGIYTQFQGPDSIVGERLETAIAYADEMGLEFAVVMIPSKRSAYAEAYVEAFPDSAGLPRRENRVYDDICMWLAERHVPCLNLTADMRREAQEGPALYFSTDGHWNAMGSEVAAELTADFLRENLTESDLTR